MWQQGGVPVPEEQDDEGKAETEAPAETGTDVLTEDDEDAPEAGDEPGR